MLMRNPVLVVSLCLFMIASTPPLQGQTTESNGSTTMADGNGALAFTMKSIDGDEVDLRQYRGKVVLVVNVASRCGLTPQYKGLQSLYDEYGGRGLVVLGFPCNQFLGQEPGTEEQIKEFCTTKYQVNFPLFSKIKVNGKNQAPLYAYLTNQDTQPTGSGKISWNFEKFLISRKGEVIGRFGPRTKPNDESLVAAIEAALQ